MALLRRRAGLFGLGGHLCGVPVLAGAAMQWGGLPTVPLLAAAGHAAVLALAFVALPSSLPAGDAAKKKE